MTAQSAPRRELPVAKLAPAGGLDAVHLRLYVASSTPNSQRAEMNLQAAILALASAADYRVEVIDVLVDGRRAVIDSVIVTPTLLAVGPRRRLVMIGDLSDTAKLRGFLESAAGGS